MLAPGQTGHASPTVADLEQLQAVNKCQHVLLGIPPLKDDGEHTCRAGKVAFPELVTGARGQRAVQDQLNFRAPGQLAGEFQRRGFASFQVDGQRFHAAQREAAIVG